METTLLETFPVRAPQLAPARPRNLARARACQMWGRCQWDQERGWDRMERDEPWGGGDESEDNRGKLSNQR